MSGVELKGVQMGDMQVKLLQKIEELTLYLFELKKENNLLGSQVKELNQRLANLEYK